MKFSTQLKPIAKAACLLVGSLGVSSVLAAPITWNGWSFEYEIGVNNEGLALKNVKYQTHTLLKKVSLPSIGVSGGTPGAPDGAGSCSKTIYLDNTLSPMPWAKNATLSQRQFSFEGRQWYEIGIYKIITNDLGDSEDYFQAYYLSADGLFDMQVYSRKIDCGYYNDRTDNWRIDIDVDGADNDLIETYRNSSNLSNFSPMLNEFYSYGYGVSVRDLATNNVVNINGSINRFKHPDGIDFVSESSPSQSTHGVLYRASEDIGWSTASNPMIYLNNAENINSKDVVSWHTVGIGSTEAWSGNWLARGVTLAPNWVPNYLPDVIVDQASYSDGKFYVKVTNRGIAPTPAGKSVGIGIYVDGVYRTWLATGRLMPGESRDLSSISSSSPPRPYFIPDGTHTITAWVDDINRFPESDETNNKYNSGTFTISGPDYTPPYLEITSPGKNSIVTGSNVILSAIAYDNNALRNVQFTLSNNDDELDFGTPLFAPKKASPYVFSWDSTTVPEGNYWLKAWAVDASGLTVPHRIPIKVVASASTQKPDLIVTNVGYANGQFSCTVKNAGTADIPAQALMTLGFYADGVYKNWTSSYGPLAAGASINLVSKGGATTLTSGSHAIKGHIDDQNLIMEGNEANNTLTKTLTVP